MSAIRDWLTGTPAGRALLVGTCIKTVTLTLAAAGAPTTGLLGALDTIGGLALVVGALFVGYRLFVSAKRRLLWRVRRKLTLSYIFIGFVPALLIISFFLLCGLLLFFNVGAYMVRSRVASLVDHTQFLAQSAALELRDALMPEQVAEALARRHAAAAARYPSVSYAVISGEQACGGGGAALPPDSAFAGPWTHLDAPEAVPPWVPCSGHAGLITYTENGRPALAARSVAWIEGVRPSRAAVVDVPLGLAFVGQLEADTGIALAEGGGQPDEGLQWVAFLEHTNWSDGRTEPVIVSFRMNLRDVYDRISGGSLMQLGAFNFGQILLIVVAVVGGSFLVIQVVALGMGLGLARSITGSVHALFAGTERVRQGDFTHRIAIHTRDQLGELAESFNSMTASMEDLLQQKAEKERLEQELRIARVFQMSLLPRGPLRMPGLSLTAHCEPAREVGGDYYDILPIDEHRLGVLIADVSGKGTSAALYMAELKGLMLSLSQLHRSPRTLLIEANRILSQHLDTRSFITITYAIVDLEARTLTHARAGHCPLMYLPGPPRPSPCVQMLSPDGLVLGLQLDAGETFNSLLEESTVPIAPGDLFVLYTDGITDATNASGDWFGDRRLAALIEEHGDLPFDELRERILREIQSFVGSAPQHDDMTMLLLKVESLGETQKAER